MKWADYCVSKLSLTDSGMIDTVIVYNDLGECLSSESEKTRTWMVQQVNIGKTFCSITLNRQGSWNRIGNFSYDGNLFTWFVVPQNLTRRKTFVSYYHHDDQDQKKAFCNIFGDLILNKSVEYGDIDSDNSDEYIGQLIKKEYLSDTTVLIVLIGSKTKCRKHVDWEIAGALNYKVGDTYAGLLGLILPGHPDYGTGMATYGLMPERLADNFKTGYAVVADWTENRINIQNFIELAFDRRSSASNRRDNTKIKMLKDTSQ